MPDVRLAYPVVLFGLFALPALMLWRRTRGRTPVRIVPHAAAWAGAGGMGGSLRIVALYAALALLIVALARPQRFGSDQKVEQQGYDLMLAIDLSTSMLSEDYQGPKGRINRLETIRPIIRQFIARRPNDRIGIAVFARRAITLAPLTTDHGWLARQVATLRTGLIEDGTAIGDGLGVALNNIARARRTGTESGGAFIILLTDGSSNSGDLTPAEATALARFRGIPVYTVGTGRNGMVPFPVFAANGRRIGTSQQPSALDIEALKMIASQTGGRFFMAGDTKALEAAFAAIDAARKARFAVRRSVRVDELFPWFALPALLLLVVAASGLGRPRMAAQA